MVLLETAKERRGAMSKGIDSRERGAVCRGVLDACERLVHFERRRNVLPELGTDPVLREAIQAQERNKR